MRLFRPDEIRRLAAAAGLTVETGDGDFAGTPLAAGNEQAIYVFK